MTGVFEVGAAAVAAAAPDGMEAHLRRELHELECAAEEARRDGDVLPAVLAEDDAARVRERLDVLLRAYADGEPVVAP